MVESAATMTYPSDEPLTISGWTLPRFDDDGLAAEPRDDSHVKQGRQLPPAGLFTQPSDREAQAGEQ
jgi:hypothetical protein